MAMCGSTNARSICIPSNQLCVDVGISSINSNQVKEMTSSLYEHAIKVRKPYMITKQRERWSEEEHEKFLEALKLHGRAWRQIEEHIGTKTAVQIRSHAQKFFSKVTHESTGDSSGSVKMIAIPPPRPKRKPAHPYPRKFGNQQKMPIPEQPEMSYTPTPSRLEQENRSPTSVLLAFGSDTSPASNLPSGCTSPLSSMAGSNQVEMLSRQCQLHVAASDEEDISPSPESNDSAMESNVGAVEDNTVYEVPSVESQTKSLKLFGMTVLVSGSQKTCPSEESSLRCPKPSGTTDVENCDESGLQAQAQAQSVQKTVDSDWSAWYGGMPPMFVCPIPCGDSGIPMPWGWAMYGTSQYQYSSMQSTSANQNPSLQNKVSVSDLNTAACQVVDSQIPTTKRIPPSNLRHSANSAFSSFATSISKSARGFKPYKRLTSP